MTTKCVIVILSFIIAVVSSMRLHETIMMRDDPELHIVPMSTYDSMRDEAMREERGTDMMMSGRPEMMRTMNTPEHESTSTRLGLDSGNRKVTKYIMHTDDLEGSRTRVMVNKMGADGMPRSILRERYQPVERDSGEFQNHIFKSTT